MLCLTARLSDPISTFAPTVPTQPAYASITPLPILTPGFRPRSAADFSHNSPTTCPADNQCPFYLSQLCIISRSVITCLSIDPAYPEIVIRHEISQANLGQKVVLP